MENTQALADAATVVASAQTQKFSLFALTMMLVANERFCTAGGL